MRKKRFARPPQTAADSLIRAFGENVVRHRKRRRMTQADLAYLSYLHPAAISEIERCTTNPTMKTIHAIALALDVEPMVLLNRRLFKSKTIAKQIASVEDQGEQSDTSILASPSASTSTANTL